MAQAESVATERFDVFLSHNSREKPEVEHLARKLKGAGLEPWLDTWCLVPGRPWQDELAEALFKSEACAFFIGPHDTGDWAREELYVAQDRATKDRGFRLVPVLLPGLPEPFDFNSLPPFIRMRTAIDFRVGIDDAHAFDRLVRAIKGLPPGADEVLDTRNDVCPYRGLEAFDEDHADFFFGRDADIQRVLEKLKGSRFLAVLGASGSGKSSVVRAGVIPALRKGQIPGSHEWEIRVFTPTSQPLTSLAAHLVQLAPEEGMKKTLEHLGEDERTLHFGVCLAVLKAPPSKRVVWVVDQFEEVFTLCRDEHERQLFLKNLLYAASVPDGRSIVILTLRADFYQKCAAYPELSQQIAAQQYLVSPMDLNGLRDVIQEPAWRVGLEFESGLAETILSDVARQPGALPLLEFALLELWKRRRGRMLTLEGYRESGGVEGAIAKTADDTFQTFSPEEQSAARNVLLRLTQPGEGTEDTRRRAAVNELASTSGDDEVVLAVVGRLVRERLLTTSTDEEGAEQWIDVSHEALIRGWPRLRQWIEADREGLREHRRLTEAAHEWQHHGHDEGYLYRGASLASAVEWRDEHGPSLNELESGFLRASIDLAERELEEDRQREQRELEAARALSEAEAEAARERAEVERERAERVTALAQADRRRARIARFFSAGMAVLLVGSIIIAIIALQERATANTQKSTAQARVIADEAMAQLPIDPELSLLLATQAVQQADLPQTERALRQALLDSHVRLTLRGHNARVNSAQFTPDGADIITAGWDNTVRIWDSHTGRQLGLLSEKGHALNRAVLSPDGNFLVTANVSAPVHIWNWRTATILASLPSSLGEVYTAAISSNDRYVAVGGKSPTVTVWDWRTSQQVASLTGTVGSVESVSFSPDGNYVMAGGSDKVDRIWNLSTQKLLASLNTNAPTATPAWSPDSQYVATPDINSHVLVWNWRQQRILQTLYGHSDSIFFITFSPDGQYVASGGYDQTARVWDWRHARPIAVLAGHHGEIEAVGFSPDGSSLVTASLDRTARVWQLPFTLIGHTKPIHDVAFTPDGRYLASVSEDGTARIWDWRARRTVTTLNVKGGWVYAGAFDPSGRYLATASEDGVVRIWDWRAGTVLHKLSQGGNIAWRVRFSGDGNYVVVAAADNAAHVWDWRAESQLASLAPQSSSTGNSATDASFSPDGKYVVSASTDQTTRVWEWRAKKIVATLDTDSTANTAVFSSDGQYVLVSRRDKVAHVWDWRRQSLVATLSGHSSDVESAAFSPNGQYVLTASDDKTAVLWDWRSHQDLATIATATDVLWYAAFSPDGTEIAAAGNDGLIRVFPCEICQPISGVLALAPRRVTRTLTPTEQRQYLP